MAVPTHALTWEQGTDLDISLIYKKGPDGSEVEINLTNYAVRMDIRANIAGTRIFTFNSEDIPGEPLADSAGSADNEAVLGSAGQINISVPRALTLPGGSVYDEMTSNNNTTFVYDIILRNKTTNKQEKILSGTIVVNRSVTQWA